MKRADTITLSLRADVVAWLNEESARRGLSVSSIVREMLLPKMRADQPAPMILAETSPPLLQPSPQGGRTTATGANTAHSAPAKTKPPRYTLTKRQP
jgi:hypothetical protein